MLLFKILSLKNGNSAIDIETIQRLVFFYNNDILPVVYKNGSLGASGDLAPLAHLSLPLIGLGEVYFKDQIVDSTFILQHYNLKPLNLKSKEGLALLNGTQFMSSYAIFLLFKSYRLSYLADLIASISLDSFNCRSEPFNELIHQIRPHNGQIKVAERVNAFRFNSEILKSKKIHTQDPYSFRCIPQVHGATYDTIQYVKDVFVKEINSVTDNPIIFPDKDLIISGGNFHGQPLAYGLDFLKIAMAELGNISERRVFNLISGERDLPAFLIKNPGLNSGFMIPQYTAASLVSLNKQLCSPSSVDSIVSSNGQEDHVSMGANSALLCYDLIENLESILSIELFTAAQAIDFRKPLYTSKFLEKFILDYRNNVKFIELDTLMYKEIDKSLKFINSYDFEDVLFTF